MISLRKWLAVACLAFALLGAILIIVSFIVPPEGHTLAVSNAALCANGGSSCGDTSIGVFQLAYGPPKRNSAVQGKGSGGPTNPKIVEAIQDMREGFKQGREGIGDIREGNKKEGVQDLMEGVRQARDGFMDGMDAAREANLYLGSPKVHDAITDAHEGWKIGVEGFHDVAGGQTSEGIGDMSDGVATILEGWHDIPN